jgi:hypothetical protein
MYLAQLQLVTLRSASSSTRTSPIKKVKYQYHLPNVADIVNIIIDVCLFKKGIHGLGKNDLCLHIVDVHNFTVPIVGGHPTAQAAQERIYEYWQKERTHNTITILLSQHGRNGTNIIDSKRYVDAFLKDQDIREDVLIFTMTNLNVHARNEYGSTKEYIDYLASLLYVHPGLNQEILQQQFTNDKGFRKFSSWEDVNTVDYRFEFMRCESIDAILDGHSLSHSKALGNEWFRVDEHIQDFGMINGTKYLKRTKMDIQQRPRDESGNRSDSCIVSKEAKQEYDYYVNKNQNDVIVYITIGDDTFITMNKGISLFLYYESILKSQMKSITTRENATDFLSKYVLLAHANSSPPNRVAMPLITNIRELLPKLRLRERLIDYKDAST